MSDASPIPRSWTNAPLANLVKSRSGNSKIIKGKQADSPSDGLVQGYSASGPDIWVREKEYSGPGIVVSAVGARCGKTFLADGDWTAIANTHAIVPSAELHPRFLWYLTNREDWWIKSGTAQPFVKVKATLERNQLLPPIEEQRRIVEILDEQLSRLDAALESVRVVSEKAAQFRRSLLHAAFIGELTTTGVDSIPASAWQRLTLNDVAKWGSGGTPKARTSAYYGGSIPWAVIGDLNDGIVESTAATITPEGLANSSAKVIEAGTVLVAMYGSIGKTGIAGMEMTTNQAIAFARPNEDVIERDYLLYYLQSQKEALAASGKGGTQKNISQTILKSWPVLVPPLQEQRKIADLIEASDARQVGALEYVDGLGSHLAAIRRSLLHAAFTGELTASWRNSR